MITFYTDKHLGVLVTGNEETLINTVKWCEENLLKKFKYWYYASDIIYIVVEDKEDFNHMRINHSLFHKDNI